MRTLFRIFTLMLITSVALHAQTETLYSKSYDANTNTTALLEFIGSTVEILKSPDDKFYIEYTIDFINYPNRKKNAARESVNIESELVNNQIMLVDKSKFSTYRYFQYENLIGRFYSRAEENKKSFVHKNKVKIRDEINKMKKPISFYIRYIENSTRHSEREKEKMIEKHNNRKQKKFSKKFIIRVPSNLKIMINSKASTISIKEGLENQMTLRADGGKLYVNNLSNINNMIKIKDATLIANSINGGELTLDNAKRTIIGKLKNVKLNSEFSQIEIGEINTNVEVTDFTSKYLIHNFSKDFEELNMNTEYSEVSLFLPKDRGYQLTTFGNYTKHFVDNKLVDFPIEKNTTSAKMLDLSEKGNTNTLNAIKINTVNGIIRIAKEDLINFGD